MPAPPTVMGNGYYQFIPVDEMLSSLFLGLINETDGALEMLLALSGLFVCTCMYQDIHIHGPGSET